MDSNTSDAHTPVEPEPSSATSTAGAPPLSIRWGRTFFAAVGLFALIVAGISWTLSIVNLGSAAVSWTGVAIFAAVVAGLRALAVRDRDLRRFAADYAASLGTTTANPPAAAPPAPAVEERETVLFDGSVGAAPAPVQKPLTAEELRQAALRVAAKGAADAKLAHTQTLAEGEFAGETWEPVEVPKPGYVTAARAAMEAEPLQVPVAPKSAGTSIKADQAGIGVPFADAPLADASGSGAAGSDASGSAAESAAGAAAVAPAANTPAKQPKNTHALANLDVVLQRRRA